MEIQATRRGAAPTAAFAADGSIPPPVGETASFHKINLDQRAAALPEARRRTDTIGPGQGKIRDDARLPADVAARPQRNRILPAAGLTRPHLDKATCATGLDGGVVVNLAADGLVRRNDDVQ
jgi:hypothetical protein